MPEDKNEKKESAEAELRARQETAESVRVREFTHQERGDYWREIDPKCCN